MHERKEILCLRNKNSELWNWHKPIKRFIISYVNVYPVFVFSCVYASNKYYIIIYDHYNIFHYIIIHYSISIVSCHSLFIDDIQGDERSCSGPHVDFQFFRDILQVRYIGSTIMKVTKKKLRQCWLEIITRDSRVVRGHRFARLRRESWDRGRFRWTLDGGRPDEERPWAAVSPDRRDRTSVYSFGSCLRARR